MKRRDLIKVIVLSPLLTALPAGAEAAPKMRWVPNDGKFYIVSAQCTNVNAGIIKFIAKQRGFFNTIEPHFDKHVEFKYLAADWARLENEIVIYKNWKEFNEASPKLIVPSPKLYNSGLSGTDSPSRILFLHARSCIRQKLKLVPVDSLIKAYRQTHVVLDDSASTKSGLLHSDADPIASFMSDAHFVVNSKTGKLVNLRDRAGTCPSKHWKV